MDQNKQKNTEAGYPKDGPRLALTAHGREAAAPASRMRPGQASRMALRPAWPQGCGQSRPAARVRPALAGREPSRQLAASLPLLRQARGRLPRAWLAARLAPCGQLAFLAFFLAFLAFSSKKDFLKNPSFFRGTSIALLRARRH